MLAEDTPNGETPADPTAPDPTAPDPTAPDPTAPDPTALATDALARLHALCEKLRTDLGKAVEAKKTLPIGAQARMIAKEGSFSLLMLKEVNRTVWEQVAILKSRSSAANEKVDAADLKLQNLQYEKNYFLREIRQAREYPPDRPIELLSREEFAKATPPETASEGDDPHEYHLARLKLELSQRTALCERRDALLGDKAKLEASLAARHGFLEGMQGELASITRISRPLQELLQQRQSTRWQEARQLELLPPPLRRVFERSLAHRDTARPALKLQRSHASPSDDLALLQMQSELNTPADPPAELTQHGGAFSLSLALQRARTLLDVYLETDGEGGGATAIRGTLCTRRVRGRDRRRPFAYDPKSGQFDQSSSALS